MQPLLGGVQVAALGEVVWVKSRRSGPSGNCVEFAVLKGGGGVAVRNSRHPEGPALIYTEAAIRALIEGVKDGDFDLLL